MREVVEIFIGVDKNGGGCMVGIFECRKLGVVLYSGTMSSQNVLKISLRKHGVSVIGGNTDGFVGEVNECGVEGGGFDSAKLLEVAWRYARVRLTADDLLAIIKDAEYSASRTARNEFITEFKNLMEI